jgi:ribonucleoside-diphosphate reductase alpha chain
MKNMVDNLLKERYCIKGETSWEDICKRVCKYIANDEEEYEEFYRILSQKLAIPNSPTLYNAGTANPMCSACFYLPVEDSIDSIFEANKNAAKIFQKGGGVGFNFSKLRPAGSIVGSNSGVASGVVSFMRVFDTMTDVVKQGGKRRGAMMGALSVNHPEIRKFITCKHDEGTLSNFNISVRLTDEFMEKVIVGDREAVEIFDMICEGVYRNGEPGVLFETTINNGNMNPHVSKDLNTNPCSEALLGDFESCNLMSIDISKFYDEMTNFIDIDKFTNVIVLCIKFLNNVIDKNKYPIPEIDIATKYTRKTGLGLMGVADLLIKMNMSYGSKEALAKSRDICVFFRNIAIDASMHLAEIDGVYPAYKGSKWDEVHHIPMRNGNVLSIAPTGSISIIAGCSSGIEPVISFVHTRNDSLGTHYVLHPLFEEDLKHTCNKLNLNYNEILRYCHENGSIQKVKSLPEDFRKKYISALDIDWKTHIDMQVVVQEYVDMSISKTINMPQGSTKEDVYNAIMYAWKKKCKGVTIYISGSRVNEVLGLAKKEVKVVTNFKRPKVIQGETYKVRSGCGKLYITINEGVNGNPYEIFIQSDGAGGCEAGNQALGRIISTALRNDVPVRSIIKQLRKVKCAAAMKNEFAEGKSCADIIGKVLLESIPDEDEEEDGELVLITNQESVVAKKMMMCINPKCGNEMEFREGCWTCPVCGHSKCG